MAPWLSRHRGQPGEMNKQMDNQLAATLTRVDFGDATIWGGRACDSRRLCRHDQHHHHYNDPQLRSTLPTTNTTTYYNTSTVMPNTTINRSTQNHQFVPSSTTNCTRRASGGDVTQVWKTNIDATSQIYICLITHFPTFGSTESVIEYTHLESTRFSLFATDGSDSVSSTPCNKTGD